MKNLNEFKSFSHGLGLLSIVNILIALSTFILLPILTKNLTINDYGIWNQIIVTITLLTAISTLGLTYTMMRFLPSIKEQLKVQEEYYSLFLVVVLSSFLISLIFFLIGKTVAITLFNGQIIIVELLSIIIFVCSLNYFIVDFFRTFQEIKKYSLFLFLQTYLMLLFVSYLVISGYGIFGAILGYLISQILLFFAMNFFIVKKIGLTLPKFKNVKEYLSFGLPIVPGALSYWIVNSSDRYIIGLFLGSAFVGYYSPGYMIGTIIVLIVSPFPSMLLPIIAKYYDSGDTKKAKTFLNYSMKLFLSIAIPSIFGLSILSKPLLMILTTPQIASNGYLITPFVAIGTLFYCIYVIISLVFALKKNTKITSYIWILAAIINLFGNIYAVPHFGIIGSAIVTMITYITASTLTILYSKKYLKFSLDFDLKFIIKSLVSSMIMTVFIFIINPVKLLNIAIAISMGSIIYVTCLLFLKGISKKELNFIKKLVIK